MPSDSTQVDVFRRNGADVTRCAVSHMWRRTSTRRVRMAAPAPLATIGTGETERRP